MAKIGADSFCYDVDADDAKFLPVGKRVFNDYQWLGNERCAMIEGSRSIVVYNRLENSLAQVAALPSLCSQIGEPSPGERFAFCLGGKGNGVLIDFVGRTAATVTGGAGVKWVSPDTFAFSREVPDSELRGTWVQKAGEGERRVSPEPYLVGTRGALLMVGPGGQVIYATKHGLAIMRGDGTAVKELIKLPHPPVRVVAIAEWRQ